MRRSLLASIGAIAVACGTILAPAPSPTPRVTEFVIPTRSPTPVVSPTPFTGHYGFLAASSAGWVVRRENDATSLGVIDLDNIAVAPNGRNVAGWTRSGAELQVREVTAPAAVAVTIPVGQGERGTFVTWSVDGSGLLFTVTGGGGAWSALRRVDIASRAVATIAQIDGVTLRPALWNRLGGDLVAAFVVSSTAPREYVLVRGVEAPLRRPLPDKAWQSVPAVSGDGQWMVIAATNEALFRTFQTDDPGFIVETYGTTARGVSAYGRPMSGEIGLVLDGELLLYAPSTGLRRRVVAPEPVDAIVGFRFDGSAALVRVGSDLRLLDVVSAQFTAVSADARFGIALP